MKVDLHVHTVFSPDSLTAWNDVLAWAQRRHLGALAITDHNSIAGALAVRDISPLPIIVGEEIHTRQGEIIGLFLQHEVPADLAAHETVRLIHQQGGLVYIPHPLDRTRRSSALDFGVLMQIIEHVDIVEVFNARVTFSEDNQMAARLTRCYGLLSGAGSDAHQGYEIGRAYVEIPSFVDAPTFRAALARAAVCGQVSSPLVHLSSTYARLAKTLIPCRINRDLTSAARH